MIFDTVIAASLFRLSKALIFAVVIAIPLFNNKRKWLDWIVLIIDFACLEAIRSAVTVSYGLKQKTFVWHCRNSIVYTLKRPGERGNDGNTLLEGTVILS